MVVVCVKAVTDLDFSSFTSQVETQCTSIFKIVVLYFHLITIAYNFRYVKNVRQLEEHNQGGGFLPAHACHRALQEAFSCLTLSLQQR